MNIPGDKPRCEKICVRTFSEFHLFPRDILADEWSLPYVRDTITWLYFRRIFWQPITYKHKPVGFQACTRNSLAVLLHS